MILAAAFFVAEAFVPTQGALAGAGAVTFVLVPVTTPPSSPATTSEWSKSMTTCASS